MPRSKKFKIGIVGTGRLSSALLNSWIESRSLKKSDIWAATRRKSTAKKVAQKFGVLATNDYSELVKNTDTLILGVKPYQLKEVCQRLRQQGLKSSSVVVSLAAGVGTARIQSFLETKNPLVLAMTNTPSHVAQGMTALFKGRYAKKQHMTVLKELFAHCGKCLVLKEEQFHEFTALAASSPAFVFYFMSAFVQSGRKMGLKEKDLKLLVSQAFLGSAQLFQNSKLDAEQLIAQVTTPGGCTAEGVGVLEASELLSIVYKTLDKTREKSKLMAQS